MGDTQTSMCPSRAGICTYPPTAPKKRSSVLSNSNISHIIPSPSKRKLATHSSAQYTRQSDDDHLRHDLSQLARRDVPLDAFLATVLGYDKDKWQPLVDSWRLSKNETFKGLQQNFVNAIKGKNEINPYRPIKDWADYVLNRAEEDKDAAPLIDLVFHLTHPETLAGEFGKKRPDITGSNKG